MTLLRSGEDQVRASRKSITYLFSGLVLDSQPHLVRLSRVEESTALPIVTYHRRHDAQADGSHQQDHFTRHLKQQKLSLEAGQTQSQLVV